MLEIHLRTPQQYETEHLYQYSIMRPDMSSVCVLCSVFAFCVMLGARRMLGAMENMELLIFINILSVNTIFVILQVR